MRDLTNPRTVERLEREAKIADKEQGEVIALVMNTIQGRSYIWRLLSECHVFAPTFNTNALSMAFNEGNRNVGLRVLADIMRYCPNQYTLMASEANGRSSTDEQRSRTDNGRNAEGSSLDDDDGTGFTAADRETALSGLVNYEAEQRAIDKAKLTE